ncbi:hypothetical protein Zmor_006784 [Zophobas morio]|uniref:Uncharacterized protein n=1 Tax=Zophobas morio TaxID=2755281 RepID=A0AA38IWU3_9CUCU|nr:hypothetical protein Zmor_006784 [Zophobas morio]
MVRSKNVTVTDTKKQVVDEIFKLARKNFKRRHTVINGFDELWQADLADFQSYAKENHGYKYVLVVIDCLSKFLWMRPLKTKSASDVSRAMESILNKGRKPTLLQTDQGKEFFNAQFSDLMKKNKIIHYHTYSVKKVAIVERVIRTIKSKLYRSFTLTASYNWTNKLENINAEYNKTRHRITGKKPIDINKQNAHEIKLYGINPKAETKHKFKEGDIVRVSKFKHIFEPGYKPSWSTELFKISKVNATNPTTYVLRDFQDRPIKGSFYEPELQKTKNIDVFLIEKVLRRKGKKLFVKWLGLPKNQQTSWISTEDLR